MEESNSFSRKAGCLKIDRSYGFGRSSTSRERASASACRSCSASPAPDASAGRGEGAATGATRVRSGSGRTARTASAAGEKKRKNNHRQDAVRPPAPESEREITMAGEVEDRVDVGKIRADDQRRGTQARFPPSGGREIGAYERVSKRIHLLGSVTGDR